MVGKIYRVVLAKQSKDTLQKIYTYYKENRSKELADKISYGLLSEAKNLKKLPNSKAKLPSKKQVVPPMRYTRKESFKIIFQVFENDDTVVILDFMHDKENPTKWETL